MNKKLPLVVSGVVFLAVAVAHIARLWFGWEVLVDGYNLPRWLSMVGAVVPLLLAFWMFGASR